MIDVTVHRQALADRIRVVNSLIDETHPPAPAVGPISRETRGLAIVLLFAAYEELLTSLTRTLLETAVQLRISNSRLQPGFRVFAVSGEAKSLRDVGAKKLYRESIPRMVEVVSRTDRKPTINTNDFPSDGSFMKKSQIELWATIFQIGHPAVPLRKIWAKIDTVVVQRNNIAHGDLTPQEVGRSYTEQELRDLINDWNNSWDDFLTHVESCASSRDFFRVPR